MSISHPLPRAARFGDFEANLRSAELRRDGHTIKVQEQPFQVLAMLLERPGEIVSREELRERLWPEDTFVDFDHSLATAILKIRNALEDSASEPRFVETVPRRGYRFIAPVETVFAESEEPVGTVPQTASTATRKRGLAALGVAVILAAAALGIALNVAGVRDRLLGHPHAIRSVVVLPFKNIGQNPDDEYLSDGITESLIDSLSNIRNLRVVPRSLAYEYKGKALSPQAAGKQLGVDAVVTGRVEVRGDAILVGTELIDTASVSQLWGRQYNHKLANLLKLQRDLARDVFHQLHLPLSAGQRSVLASEVNTDPQAYLLYLRSRQMGRAFWLPDTLKRSAEYARQAVEKDPNFALGYAGLADAYIRLGMSVILPQEAFPKAKEAALKALELDDRIGEAHASLADVKCFYEWDWAGAEKEYRRAIELKPDDAELLRRYAKFLVYLGRFEEGLAEGRRAHELDPLSPTILASFAEDHILARQYEKGIELGKKAIELDPHCGQAYAFVSSAYFQMGKFDQSNAYYLRQRQELGASAEEITKARREFQTVGAWGSMEMTAKREEEKAARGERLSFTGISMCYGSINKRKESLAWLEKAFQAHDPILVMIRSGPQWDSVRSDPRFQKILHRMNLDAPDRASQR